MSLLWNAASRKLLRPLMASSTTTLVERATSNPSSYRIWSTALRFKGDGNSNSGVEKRFQRMAETKGNADDNDDWYADFDPSSYDAYKHTSNAGHSSSSTSAGNHKQQAAVDGHDYTRDSVSDSSNVDLNRVNYLLSERLQRRKTGQFDQADAIRDELLEAHGVLIRDKERTWRSGCSKSSSNNSGSGNNNPRRMRDTNQSGRRDNNTKRGRPKELGPHGHDYELAKDAGPNTSQLLLDEINDLLKERLEYKFNRDYKAADVIQRELFGAGVLVNDRSKEWRADGNSFEGYGTTTYTFSGNAAAAPANLDEIQAMVDQRARAKSERLYKEADKLRDELADQFDIFIDDRNREWRVDQKDNFMPPKKRELWASFAISETSETPEDHDEIQELVERRDNARADRDFDTADDIRDQLLHRNIFLDDRNRQWSLGDAGLEDEIYVRRGGGTISEEEEQAVVSMLRERDVHKRNRRYDSADAIRDKLRIKFNVRMDDRNKEWHVATDEYSMSNKSAPMDADTKTYIEEQITKRALAKLQKDYETADAIREELKEEYQVSIDDNFMDWIKIDYGKEEDRDTETTPSTIL